MKDSIIELLRPQNIFKSKKRLGASHEDGGYIVAEYICENCAALFSYGIGNDTRFEEDFSSQYHKPTYMFDHTPSAYGLALKVNEDEIKRYTNELARLKSIQCHFFAEGLGHEENCKDFNQHYEERGTDGYVLLKMDVEGYEYTYFQETDISKLADRVMGIVMEIHWVTEKKNRENTLKILNAIEEYFVLYHIHGNSWGELKTLEGRKTPETLELSFINKKFIDKYEPDLQNYPIPGLDVSNRPGKPDYELTFLRDDDNETSDISLELIYAPIVPEECMQMLVGDVVDRYTICRLKSERGGIDSFAEIKELSDAMLKYQNILPYIDELYKINGEIWDLESDIKVENEKILGLEEIGRRALKIRDLNILRVNLKNEINLKYNEGFTETATSDVPVIISLTTVPEKLADMSEIGIMRIIKTLCEQNNGNYEIHINIPNINVEYAIPNWLTVYQSKYPYLKIFRGKKNN